MELYSVQNHVLFILTKKRKCEYNFFSVHPIYLEHPVKALFLMFIND